MAEPLNDDENVLDIGLAAFTALTSAGKMNFAISTDSDPSLIAPKAADNFLGHWPAGGTQRQVNHFGQLVRTGNFEEYNLGPIENMRRYGYENVRSFNFDNI